MDLSNLLNAWRKKSKYQITSDAERLNAKPAEGRGCRRENNSRAPCPKQNVAQRERGRQLKANRLLHKKRFWLLCKIELAAY